ncbi:MAG: Smr/MutS family protein [Rikenellaceae bacterium]
MIYPSNFEQKIGFSRLREQVAAKCSMLSARERVLGEGFATERAEILGRLYLVDEMRSILLGQQRFPKSECSDIDQIIDQIDIVGNFIEVDEIVEIRKALDSVDAILKFIHEHGEKHSSPALSRLAEKVCSFPEILSEIDRIVDRFNKIKDNASTELFEIRRKIRDFEGQLSKRLLGVLNAAKSAGLVDSEAQISIRDGRAVIPVAAGNKRKLQGFIHDESATGKTVYIEPVEVVQINNELKDLEHAQRREIVRILTSLTDSLRPHSEELRVSSDFLSHIDMIYAKATWALENSCVMPILSNDDRLVLYGARHPLLEQTLKGQGKAIVPLDMQLDRKRHILVISGPNAGGKSVCLKTTGIIQYMFQCGYLVPAKESSELQIFDSIYIDIGDEQSIDNDLSTYSSHLLNMKNMVAGASSRTLVLIDEFGSGTEPVMGGAIAEAILDRLLSKGCYGVITTHYSNIKYYASLHEGIANGAMSFDVQRIMPLFRLEMGKPGSSFAVEIARKIGLPEEIIRSASEKAGAEHVNLEKQLREIARDRRYWEQKRDRIRQAERKIEELESSYSEQLAKIKQERSEILHRAKAEAKELISEANRQIESTIKSIREAQAEREITKLARREIEEFKQVIDKADNSVDSSLDVAREMERLERRQQRRKERKERQGTEIAPTPEPPKPKEITIGAKVSIKGQESLGEVQSIKGKRVQVAFGHILTMVDKERLTVVSSAEYKRQSRPSAPTLRIATDISERRLNFKDNIDLRGMRAADALDSVQNFIDDALMVGVSSVAILHGKGTGALKEEIRRYLKCIPEIKRAGDAHADRGGAGITVVEFNE